MSEAMSNADPIELRLSYYGRIYGCGWCGAASMGDFPDCCPKMANWKRRFAEAVRAPTPLPEPEPHDVARWHRVQRRWEGKHA